jgi:hypothetical protein
VLAQKFKITPWRAAGVVQLQHNEETMRRNHPELLCEEQARYAEETILDNIRQAYRSERSYPPTEDQPFVEDPVGIHGRGEPDETSSSFVGADDIYDMEAKLGQANKRDDELARILIDDHVYKEDVDESTLPVKTDGAAQRLIKAKREYSTRETKTGTIPYPETNVQGVKRPRWKYVAKVVNTRTMRKKGRRNTSYTNNNIENTLVEEDGALRVATVEEAKQAAWKPTRTKGNEYIYDGVKRAWLEKTVGGKTDVWGKAPKMNAADAVAKGGSESSTKATATTAPEPSHEETDFMETPPAAAETGTSSKDEQEEVAAAAGSGDGDEPVVVEGHVPENESDDDDDPATEDVLAEDSTKEEKGDDTTAK